MIKFLKITILFLTYYISLNQCKKFAKPELKVCIEEFEEKLNKVHQEKKEQEATTKNAEAHRQRIGSLDEFLVTKETEAGQNSGNSAEGKQKNFHFFLFSLSCTLLHKLIDIHINVSYVPHVTIVT
jgi:hypothetical protein